MNNIFDLSKKIDYIRVIDNMRKNKVYDIYESYKMVMSSKWIRSENKKKLRKLWEIKRSVYVGPLKSIKEGEVLITRRDLDKIRIMKERRRLKKVRRRVREIDRDVAKMRIMLSTMLYMNKYC